MHAQVKGLQINMKIKYMAWKNSEYMSNNMEE